MKRCRRDGSRVVVMLLGLHPPAAVARGVDWCRRPTATAKGTATVTTTTTTTAAAPILCWVCILGSTPIAREG